MTTSYQPWPVHQTFQPLDIPLAVDGGTEDITNVLIANFTMTFHPTVGADFTGTGTFIVKVLSPAEVYYKFSPSDVSQAFSGVLVVSAYYPPSNSNLDEVVFDDLPFVITAK